MEEKRLEVALEYFLKKGWKPFPFQLETWNDFLNGKSGLLNAPTGSGKTFALWFPVILEYIKQNPTTWQKPKNNGIQLIWVTPLRALSKDIQLAMQEVCDSIGLPWKVAVRRVRVDEAGRSARQPPLGD